jgi:hypothetical protein
LDIDDGVSLGELAAQSLVVARELCHALLLEQ